MRDLRLYMQNADTLASVRIAGLKLPRRQAATGHGQGASDVGHRLRVGVYELESAELKRPAAQLRAGLGGCKAAFCKPIFTDDSRGGQVAQLRGCEVTCSSRRVVRQSSQVVRTLRSPKQVDVLGARKRPAVEIRDSLTGAAAAQVVPAQAREAGSGRRRSDPHPGPRSAASCRS